MNNQFLGSQHQIFTTNAKALTTFPANTTMKIEIHQSYDRRQVQNFLKSFQMIKKKSFTMKNGKTSKKLV